MISQSQRASRLTSGGLVVDSPEGPVVLGGANLAVWVALDGRELALTDLVDEVTAMTEGSVDPASVEASVHELIGRGLLCPTSST